MNIGLHQLPKIPIFVYFEALKWNNFVCFMANWCLVYDRLVDFVVMWYVFSSFYLLNHKKSGNPDPCLLFYRVPWAHHAGPEGSFATAGFHAADRLGTQMLRLQLTQASPAGTSWDQSSTIDCTYHRDLRNRRRMFSRKWTIRLVKQGNFKVGVVPADGLGRLLLTAIFVFFEWGSLAMSAGSNPMNFGRIWSSCMQQCILLLVPIFLW
jgi:hypothetical protein